MDRQSGYAYKVNTLIVPVVLFFLTSVIPLCAQSDDGSRFALVIGNGSYESGPLANPVNDATDVAEALRSSGFKVTLVTNRTLEQMENDLREFQRNIDPGDTVLLYYAGHGVQVDGQNYLLPVNNGSIQDSSALTRRSISASEYITAMADVRTALNIVILDACRDNPLPAASRGGSRGLAAIERPRNSETVIMFSTGEGEVAVDGRGRNSTFTTAFLDTIRTPDLELTSFFNEVGSRVREASGNKQVPALYMDPLSEPFYFLSSAEMVRRAEAASAEAQEEVARLEAEIVARQQQIASSQNARDRQALEVEQQRQQAILAAQRLEAENLQREADRRARESAEALRREEERTRQTGEAQRQQEQIAQLAAQRRSELERLSRDARSDDPDVLIETINRLDGVLSGVAAEYGAAWRNTEEQIRASFEQRFADLNGAQAEIWETDEEFTARIVQERRRLTAELQTEITTRRNQASSEQSRQTATIRSQYDDALETLAEKGWVEQGSNVTLIVGEYDRNARQWPFTVSSTQPWLQIDRWEVIADFSALTDPRQAIIDTDTAVKANALAGEIEWGLIRDEENDRYIVEMKAVRVRNLTTQEVVAMNEERVPVASTTTTIDLADSLVQLLRVQDSGDFFSATLLINEKEYGQLPTTVSLFTLQEQRVKVVWTNGTSVTQIFDSGEDLPAVFTVTRMEWFVGDIGPAGGIIFYDKGSYSDGWRYLEAAPSDQRRITWRGYWRLEEVGTSKDIGTGAANTAAIVAQLGIVRKNAARVCSDLVLGGYDDWFLPSQDELNQMYQQKEVIGGFASGYYWSSSEYDSSNAWYQYFLNGFQGSDLKFTIGRVRAIRAF